MKSLVFSGLVILGIFSLISKVSAACQEGSLLPNSNNCSTYYICNHGRPLLQPCPAGLYFNSQNNVCDWPINVKCGYDSTRALDCYQCAWIEGESNDKSCKENPSKNNLIRCSAAQSVNYVCTKEIGKVNGVKRVIRGCTHKTSDMKMKCTKVGDLTDCLCDSDGCNGSRNVQTISKFLFILIAISKLIS